MAHDSEINQKEFLKHKKEADIMIHGFYRGGNPWF